MTLQEAIKSGKPFRRRGWECHVEVVSAGLLRFVNTGDGNDWDEGDCYLTAEDITAEDWELVERPVTITASQFWHAVNVVWQGQQTVGLFRELTRKLGLEK